VEHVVRLARETVRETAAYAEKTGQTELFRSVAKAVAEEVAAVLRG
jgi:hypothetical protein